MRENPHVRPDDGELLRRYQALLEMADVVVHHSSLSDLFEALADRLHEVVRFEYANFSLYDPIKKVMRLHTSEGSASAQIPQEVSTDEAASGWVWKNQKPLVIADLAEESRFPVVFDVLRERGLHSYCMLPLTTPRERLGALGLGSAAVAAYTDADVLLLTRVAHMVALAVENTLTREQLKEKNQKLEALVDTTGALVGSLDLESLLPRVAESIRRAVPHEYASVAICDWEAQVTEAYALVLPRAATSTIVGEVIPMVATASLPMGRSFTREGLASLETPVADYLLESGIRSMLCLPLITSKGVIGTLNVGRTRDEGFGAQEESLLRQISSQVAIAVDNARAYREIATLKDKLAEEKLYLEDEIRTELGFEEIVGASSTLKRVLMHAKTVSPSSATVLILGETGTGKELVARAIHRMSSRKDASFIKLNCAAIPTGLLESELFGHEKGAFTGAISQKVGRLELADKGTLFLDEVGDIPIELQPKLLRVLQDQEFERLGATRTIKVNVRLISATNRDLEQLVGERLFRSDLYYRLNVFPLRVPPLRERQKDIPLLVRYFVQKFSRRMDKSIDTIPADAMDALVNWRWPGNVRELENFIERSVILTGGTVLRCPLAELRSAEGFTEVDGTLEGVEREHILRALRESGGVIAGTRGAAARLGMKRTTLQSRMAKLGITRAEYTN